MCAAKKSVLRQHVTRLKQEGVEGLSSQSIAAKESSQCRTSSVIASSAPTSQSKTPNRESQVQNWRVLCLEKAIKHLHSGFESDIVTLRKLEIQEISSTVEKCLRSNRCGLLHLCGSPGVGKTCCVSHVLRSLQSGLLPAADSTSKSSHRSPRVESSANGGPSGCPDTQMFQWGQEVYSNFDHQWAWEKCWVNGAATSDCERTLGAIASALEMPRPAVDAIAKTYRQQGLEVALDLLLKERSSVTSKGRQNRYRICVIDEADQLALIKCKHSIPPLQTKPHISQLEAPPSPGRISNRMSSSHRRLRRGSPRSTPLSSSHKSSVTASTKDVSRLTLVTEKALLEASPSCQLRSRRDKRNAITCQSQQVSADLESFNCPTVPQSKGNKHPGQSTPKVGKSESLQNNYDDDEMASLTSLSSSLAGASSWIQKSSSPFLLSLIGAALNPRSKLLLIVISNSTALATEIRRLIQRVSPRGTPGVAACGSAATNSGQPTAKSPEGVPFHFVCRPFSAYSFADLKQIVKERISAGKAEATQLAQQRGLVIPRNLEDGELFDVSALDLLIRKISGYNGDCRQLLNACRHLLGQQLASAMSDAQSAHSVCTPSGMERKRLDSGGSPILQPLISSNDAFEGDLFSVGNQEVEALVEVGRTLSPDPEKQRTSRRKISGGASGSGVTTPSRRLVASDKKAMDSSDLSACRTSPTSPSSRGMLTGSGVSRVHVQTNFMGLNSASKRSRNSDDDADTRSPLIEKERNSADPSHNVSSIRTNGSVTRRRGRAGGPSPTGKSRGDEEERQLQSPEKKPRMSRIANKRSEDGAESATAAPEAASEKINVKAAAGAHEIGCQLGSRSVKVRCETLYDDISISTPTNSLISTFGRRVGYTSSSLSTATTEASSDGSTDAEDDEVSVVCDRSAELLKDLRSGGECPGREDRSSKIGLKNSQDLLSIQFQRSKEKCSELISDRLPLHQQVLLCAVCASSNCDLSAEGENLQTTVKDVEATYAKLCTVHGLPQMFGVSGGSLSEGLDALQQFGIIAMQKNQRLPPRGNRRRIRAPATSTLLSTPSRAGNGWGNGGSTLEVLLPIEDVKAVLRDLKTIFRRVLEG